MIVGGVPSDELLGDGLPLVAVDFVGLEQLAFVCLAPETVVYLGTQVIVPSAFYQQYLSLHCLPVLSHYVYPHSFSETSGHFLVPYLPTNLIIC